MSMTLYYFHAAPNIRLHLMTLPGFPAATLEWLLGRLHCTDRTLTLKRGAAYKGFNSDVVLDALQANGWAVLGSGFR